MVVLNSINATASSGLQAAQLRLGTSAHNVANQQTAQFQRQSAVQQTQPGGGVTASVQTAQGSGTRLEADMVEQMSATYNFKANLKILHTADQMLGTLLDEYA
ncbi:MAG: flagellar basal body rod protein [Burkholderiaceae bacterium]|nr:flagellar basal body rod protein [Burkholderiaceae bacterium]